MRNDSSEKSDSLRAKEQQNQLFQLPSEGQIHFNRPTSIMPDLNTDSTRLRITTSASPDIFVIGPVRF